MNSAPDRLTPVVTDEQLTALRADCETYPGASHTSTNVLALLDEIAARGRALTDLWDLVDAWRAKGSDRETSRGSDGWTSDYSHVAYRDCADTLAKALPLRPALPVPVLDVNAADPVAEARRYAAAVEEWAARKDYDREDARVAARAEVKAEESHAAALAEEARRV